MPSPIAPATGLQARLSVWGARRYGDELLVIAYAEQLPASARANSGSGADRAEATA